MSSNENWLANYYRERDGIRDPQFKERFKRAFEGHDGKPGYLVKYPGMLSKYYSDDPKLHQEGLDEIRTRYNVLKSQMIEKNSNNATTT